MLGKSGQPPQLDVLLVVAPNPMVNGRVAVMEGAGLEPVAVDVEAFALLRAIAAAGLMPPAGEAAVVMNLGATYTDLNIVSDSSVLVSRSLPVGGNALTASLTSVLNVTPQEAELHKHTLSVSGESAAAEPAAYGAPDPVRQVTVPFLDELVREVRRSVLYFQSQAAEAGLTIPVETLILAGGGTQLQGLPEYLAERVGVRVVALDPLSLRNADGLAGSHCRGRGVELAVALGLALKEYH